MSSLNDPMLVDPPKDFFSSQVTRGEKLKFHNSTEHDVYNITAPFKLGGEWYMAARVEARQDELNSKVQFFTEQSNGWHLVPHAPEFVLQDPFVASLGNEIIFGGIELFPDAQPEWPKAVGYRTVFYRGTTLFNLRRFAQGPKGMKDIRLVELPLGIGVFTRPGTFFTRPLDGVGGKIGFTTIKSLDQLTEECMAQTPIIEGLFNDHEWGGVNELHVLDSGRVGAIGHVGTVDDDGTKHYRAMSFVFDPASGNFSQLSIIAERSNFPLGPDKRPDLKDVVFAGGMVRHLNGMATLYAGLSDVEAGYIVITDPFFKDSDLS